MSKEKNNIWTRHLSTLSRHTAVEQLRLGELLVDAVFVALAQAKQPSSASRSHHKNINHSLLAILRPNLANNEPPRNDRDAPHAQVERRAADVRKGWDARQAVQHGLRGGLGRAEQARDAHDLLGRLRDLAADPEEGHVADLEVAGGGEGD